MSLNCTATKSNSTRAGERPSQLKEPANTNPGRIRKFSLNLVNVFDFVNGDSGFENMIKRSMFLTVFELLFNVAPASAISRQASLSRVAIPPCRMLRVGNENSLSYAILHQIQYLTVLSEDDH